MPYLQSSSSSHKPLQYLSLTRPREGLAVVAQQAPTVAGTADHASMHSFHTACITTPWHMGP